MEQYFDLHGVPLLQKVCIASSYLEPDQFLWYKGIFSRKKLFTWPILTEEMIAHYEDTKSNTFFRETPKQLERGQFTECFISRFVVEISKFNLVEI